MPGKFERGGIPADFHKFLTTTRGTYYMRRGDVPEELKAMAESCCDQNGRLVGYLIGEIYIELIDDPTYGAINWNWKNLT